MYLKKPQQPSTDNWAQPQSTLSNKKERHQLTDLLRQVKLIINWIN